MKRTDTTQKKHFTTHDGVSLFYRHVPAEQAEQTDTELTARKAIVMFHRGHEHSERMMFLADELKLPAYDFFAWDARGHGHSPGERGDSPSVGASVKDIDYFIQHISDTYGIAIENIIVLAQSVGAVMVGAWLHDYAPKVRGAVLASPAFKVKLYVPFARLGLAIMHKLFGNFFVQSYVKARYLTHDEKRIASYDSDPLIAKAISVRILLGLYNTANRVVNDAQAITTPTQLFLSGDDWVVHHGPQHTFYNNLGSPIKERHVMDGFFHDTLGEKARAPVLRNIKRFVEECFSEKAEHTEQQHYRIDSTAAHLVGHSRREADDLATPLSVWTPRGFYWALSRWFIGIGSMFSAGMKLGRETGFDSGSTLDYVYENQAQGKLGVGKLVDRQYLNAIGWRGIRQRKVHVESLLTQAMQSLVANGKPITLLDIAAGHGRYVLDAIQKIQQTTQLFEHVQHIYLQDYSEINVTAGNALIKARGLSKQATFKAKDAFDVTNYNAFEQPITLGVVSGLFELFSDNDMVMNALTGFANAIETDGYLIYTNQPWHPQLEMIARCLTSHRQGADWIMRRRTQQEMDQLVEKAGFAKVDQLIDEDGIFTVSLAKKLAN